MLVGALVYLFLMRKMTGEMVLAAVLTTVALGILLRGVMVLVWSAQQQYPAQALGFVQLLDRAAGRRPHLALRGAAGRLRRPWSTALCLPSCASAAGACACARPGQNPLLAAQRGINLHAVYALAWGLSTFTGALAGMLIALDSGLGQTMAMIGLKAFPAALVGGLDSLVGALLGSLIVAAAEVLLIHYVDPLLSDVVPFLVLIAMLVVRPWGLFGTREELDRV